MMNQQQFLIKLQQTAKRQAKVAPTHSAATAFFWRHAAWFWTTFALIAAVMFEIYQGRCG